jgi:hypothetical protein
VVADLHFDFELPPFNEGVYREDVPKGENFATLRLDDASGLGHSR